MKAIERGGGIEEESINVNAHDTRIRNFTYGDYRNSVRLSRAKSKVAE